MNPKKHNTFKEDIAKEVGVHPDVVDAFITFYYGKVRKNLSDLNCCNLHLDGLGTFSLRKKRLENKIKRYKSILGNLTKMTFGGYDKHVAVKEKLNNLENALSLIEKNEKRKEEWQEKHAIKRKKH